MLCSSKEQGVSKLCYHAISRIKKYLAIASAGLSPTLLSCGNNELNLCRVCLLHGTRSLGGSVVGAIHLASVVSR